jgi:DNA-binding CsgD family transcriptional regulator
MQVIQENMLNPDAKVTRSYFDLDYLTKRESEVLKLICDQKTTNEIAEQLFISPRTVEGHRNNMLLQTESHNVAGLVVFAFQHKIVELKESF